MSTKIVAAKLGALAGVTTIITRSSNPGNILSIVRYLSSSAALPSIAASGAADQPGDSLLQATASLNIRDASTMAEDVMTPPLHTRFVPSSDPIQDRYFWLLHTPHPQGTVYIDSGCHRALQNKAGLLPVGVVDVEGNFAQQEVVSIAVVQRRSSPGPGEKRWDGEAEEVGRAMVNYAAAEITRIMGHQSAEIEDLLGYADSEYVAHRSHIGFFRRESRPVTPTRELDHRGREEDR